MAENFAQIAVRLRDLAQLFNSMDPSPFLDRDLDADAEEFIVSWAREHRTDAEFELVIHLAATAQAGSQASVEEAVRHYFSVRAQIKQREFRTLMRQGRKRLVIGGLFLVGCLLLGGIVGRLGTGPTSEIAHESLTILGWVAMWGPLQLYLYDWWPVWEEQRLFARLARVHVRLVLAT